MENETDNSADPDYEVDEIILILESIRNHGTGGINPWKALLCLAKEIKVLQAELKKLKHSIPE